MVTFHVIAVGFVVLNGVVVNGVVGAATAGSNLPVAAFHSSSQAGSRFDNTEYVEHTNNAYNIAESSVSSTDVRDDIQWLKTQPKGLLRRQPKRLHQQHGDEQHDESGIDNEILLHVSRLIDSTVKDHRVLQEVSSNPLSFLPYWFQIVMIGLLLLLSATFSGLTLGYLGLDITGLEVVIGSDNIQQSLYAQKVLPIRKYGNLLLCTLIFGNVAVNSLLSILMADKIGGIIGFAASTVLIVIFGEVLPQAACARYALAIGSACAPLVKFVVCLFYPVAKPLAALLDCVLGQELLTIYNESEMLKFLQIHVDENAIDKETAATMGGAMKYKNLYVKDTMTPIDNVYMISCDDILNFTLLASIFKSGYSRIPIYQLSKHNIVGLLFVKDLIFLDPDDNVRVLDFIEIFSRQLNIVWYDDKLGTVLRELKQGKSHMALVRDVVSNDPNNPNLDPYYIIRGIITLEDIIEIILGDDIVDETDLQIVDDPNFNNVGGTATTSTAVAAGISTTKVTVDTKGIQPQSVSRTNESDNNLNMTANARAITKATSMSAMVNSSPGSTSNGGMKHNNNRRLDWGRLRSLDSKFVDEILNDDEVHAIVAHLQKNYSPVFALINEVQMYKLISESRVVVYDPTTTETDSNLNTNQYQYQSVSSVLRTPHSSSVATILPVNKELVLYTKETVADTSLLILSGKVTIVVGESNFTSDVSSWYLLCPRALQVSSYLPDFTAYVKTIGNPNKCRCLQITKSRYEHAIDASAYERIGVLATTPIISIPEEETNTIVSSSAAAQQQAPSSRSLLLASSSASSSSNLVPAANVVVVESVDAGTLSSALAAVAGTTTISTGSFAIKSKGSSDSSDGRTKIQKFQDALQDTSLPENSSRNIDETQK